MSEENQTFQRCPHDKENPYVMVSTSLIRDNRISPQCRWLLIYLLSNKDGWEIRMKQIANHCKGFIGRDCIYKIVQEAIEFGYMSKEEGFGKVKYFVHEFPKERKSLSSYQLPENQDTGSQDTGSQGTKERIIEEKKEQIEVAPPAIAEAMCKFLHSEIKKNKPNYSKPISKNWIKNSEKLLKIRSPEELRKVIDWAMKDSFWSGVILSPDSLEKNLDKIEMQMVKKSDPKSSPVSRVEENAKLAKKIVKAFPNHQNIMVGYNYIEFISGAIVNHIKFEDNGFEEQVKNCLRKLNISLDA